MGKIEKIEKLAAKGKSDKIAALIRDKDPAVRTAAVLGLGTVGDNNAVNILVTLLRDQDPDIRIAAIKSLGVTASRDSRDTQSKSHLQYLKNSEKDERVIKVLEETMGLISKAKQSS